MPRKRPSNDTNASLFDRRGRNASAHYARQVGACAVCGATPVLTRVGTKGYCRVHRAAAVAHTRRNTYWYRSRDWPGDD